MRGVFAGAALCALALPAAELLVTFPAEGERIASTPQVHVIGGAETNAAARLYLNGVEVERHRTGAFLAMVRTREGENAVTVEQGTNTLTRRFVVLPPAPPPAASAQPRPPRNPRADLGLPANAVYAAKPPRGAAISNLLVMVDAGHGGGDFGARTPRGLKEKDYNLEQTRAVAAALRRAGFRVSETRTDDSFPALYDRPKRAIAERADLFISIHHNAAPAGGNPREARHTVAYASNDAGLALARAIQRHVGPAVAPVKDKGGQMMSLAVCRNPAVPSCLLEIDFIDLPEGEEDSLDPARRERVAQGVVLGVLDWLSR